MFVSWHTVSTHGQEAQDFMPVGLSIKEAQYTLSMLESDLKPARQLSTCNK